MRVVLLRHAESEFNADPRSKTKDCSLSEYGRKQARSLDLGHFSLVVVSPLKRARETLNCSKITFDEAIINPLVREFRVDPCDFLEDESIDCIESDDELIERGDLFLRYLHEIKANHQQVLVVSHCEFICSLTGQSPCNAETVILSLT